MVVLAALTGWILRGLQFKDPPPPPRAAHTEQPVLVNDEPDAAAPPSLTLRAARHEASRGDRNLFAYRDRDTTANVVEMPAAAPLIVTPPPAVIAVQSPAPPPIPFPYRYIGTFGPAHNRIAAFKRDGDVITVRTGDRIGEFVLRSIGVESAEIEGPDGTRRIPLSSDV